ncbi:MAG TPA: hypothetical protein VHI98_20320 [Vicinamibacterales bacterium]|jgi:hypothetical protein|nr:hypothetical protein [Vicinamibacterales bacterium]
MVPILSLSVPILLSAVLVFVASFIIYTVLPIHRNDFRQVPKEDELMDALRRLGISPGDYLVPHPGSREGMKSPEFVDKMTRGPAAVLTVFPPGPPSMGTSLSLWFVYCIVVSVIAAYIAGRALGAGAEYLSVFRFAGTTAFVGYALALPQNSIWYKRNWGATTRSMADGLVYGLLTAGAFGWLWPR